MEVGLIGLGSMGSGIAKSLLRAGHRLTVFNRTRTRAEALRSDGANVAGSIADACRGDAVLTKPRFASDFGWPSVWELLSRAGNRHTPTMITGTCSAAGLSAASLRRRIHARAVRARFSTAGSAQPARAARSFIAPRVTTRERFGYTLYKFPSTKINLTSTYPRA
jgi:pyrroline-5-carboxylate reductase